MSSAPDTGVLRKELQRLGWPHVTVLDVSWGKVRNEIASCFAEAVSQIGLAYVPIQKGTGTPSRVASVVQRHLANRGDDEITVVLHAATTRDWKAKERALTGILKAFPRVHLVVLKKPSLGDVDEAVARVAQALQPNSRPASSETSISRLAEPEEFAARVRKATRVARPFVLIVCGNETQQRAQEQFADKLRGEMGIDGDWILTDYDRPERVVDRIREIVAQRSPPDGKCEVVAVLFSQRRNATNVKRDGQAFLRTKSIFSATPDFKSLGSALNETRRVLEKMCDESDGQGSADGCENS